MRWSDEYGNLVAETPVGLWSIEKFGAGARVAWFPTGCGSSGVFIGTYRTQGAAKGAAKRYAKKMAAAFKAMGKAGWQ